MGLHYSGHLVLGDRLSIAERRRMANRYGSACHLFVLSRSDESWMIDPQAAAPVAAVVGRLMNAWCQSSSQRRFQRRRP